MEDIKRYRYSDGWDNYGYPCHREDENGSCVYYKDYLATAEKLKAEIDLLKMQQGMLYQNGWIDGYANGSAHD